MTDQSALLARIAGLLDEASIPYMVVGSLASSFHGEPRQTRDIDIVIDPTPEALRRFLELLPPDAFYADADAAADALDRRAAFNIVEMHTGWKVDLIVRRDRPFSREELGRRIRVRLLDTEADLATAEDTIIAKLEWATDGQSERQLRDVVAIVETQGDSLDREYLDRWVRALGLEDAWGRALALAEDG
jgi:hypothetical protein